MNGLQVWPGEVENVIRLYPGISDVVVAGIPDTETGERPKAWIIPVGDVVIDINTLEGFVRITWLITRFRESLKWCGNSLAAISVSYSAENWFVRIMRKNIPGDPGMFF